MSALQMMEFSLPLRAQLRKSFTLDMAFTSKSEAVCASTLRKALTHALFDQPANQALVGVAAPLDVQSAPLIKSLRLLRDLAHGGFEKAFLRENARHLVEDLLAAARLHCFSIRDAFWHGKLLTAGINLQATRICFDSSQSHQHPHPSGDGFLPGVEILNDLIFGFGWQSPIGMFYNALG
jgi:hypothetical protein